MDGDGSGAWSRASVAFAAAGGLAVLLFALAAPSRPARGAFVALGVACCVALLVGPRAHRVSPRWPWSVLAGGCALLLGGAVLRPWAVRQDGLAASAGDALTVPGYLLLIAAFAGLLRSRGSLRRHAVLDGLIACLGAGLVSMLLLALPAASIRTRPQWVSVLAGVYPVFDVVVFLILVNFAFTTVAGGPSLRMVLVAMAALLVGDVGYAVIGVEGRLTGPPLLNLPFLVSFTLLGAAALHPSVRELARTRDHPVQAWSWRRLAVLLPALAVPSVLLVLPVSGSPVARLVLAGGTAAIMGLLLARAAAAVAEYARAEEASRYQATHDALTGLPNRLALSEEVRRLLAARRRGSPPLWLLFLDLDGFKLVNDSWGHDTGDRLIAEVGARIRRSLGADAVIARLGGDEFVVARLATDHEAAAIADTVLATLAEPLAVRGAEVVISGSIGMVSATGPVTAESLLRDADTAMYQAKVEGRNRAVAFDASMRRRVRERVEIELALRHAVATAQLRIAYQPVVDLTDGHVCGAEALLRWDHPVRGTIPPAEFVPVAEDIGLISAIGLQVLDTAMAQVHRWRATGVVDDRFWVSVNVSPRQLRDGRVPEAVRAGLARHELPPDALVLEITESAVLETTERSDGPLQRLRDLGVRLAVDDFGTGYSALGHLRRAPVTTVKIDRGFVTGVATHPGDEEIVRAVVAMSAALGLGVVAEGVESRDQLDVLVAMGVRYAQGELWSPAVRPEAFPGSGLRAATAG